MAKKSEEKGSDVNVATHLMMDAYEKRFDVAIVVSNDSDLVEPIALVSRMPGLTVKLLNPYPKTQKKLLQAVGGHKNIKYIRGKTLESSQFPDRLRDSTGNFSIPSAWK